jgi:hypothetical protein
MITEAGSFKLRIELRFDGVHALADGIERRLHLYQILDVTDQARQLFSNPPAA